MSSSFVVNTQKGSGYL